MPDPSEIGRRETARCTVAGLTWALAVSGVLCFGEAAADETRPTEAPARIGTWRGLDVYRFPEPRPYVVPVMPAVVVVLERGAAVPDDLRERGRSLGGLSWRVPSSDPVADAARWASREGVRIAEPDIVLQHGTTGFDDPEYGGQWYLEDLEMAALFDVSLGDPTTVVAVNDSGIEIAHPDLAPGVRAPFDAVDGDLDPSPNLGEYCEGGALEICDTHGTSVAGIVAARADNAVGIVGLCPACTLVPIKLLAEGGSPLSADVQAFEHAIEEDAAVINNSWGYTTSIPAPLSLSDAIHRAATETRGGLGALVVFAAGNDDREILDDEVEALPDVLCVSAVDSYGRPTAYTSWGASVDVSAPSATVTLTVGGGVTTTFGGTSAAAPVASGLAGWIASVAPELSASEIAELLVSTAKQSPLITPDENGHHDVYGFGILNPPAILERLFPTEDPDAGPPDGGPDLDAGHERRAAGGGCSCGTTRTSNRDVGLGTLFVLGWALAMSRRPPRAVAFLSDRRAAEYVQDAARRTERT